MMPRSLPHLQLTGAFTNGSDNWGDAINANLAKLSALVQCNVISTLDTKPTTPTVGVYLLSGNETTFPNNIAIFDNGVWTHIAPQAGWIIFDRLAAIYRYYTGTAWSPLPINSLTLAGLASINSTNGVIEQTGTTTFVKRAIGAFTSNDIISRGVGDARYSPISHVHPNPLSFSLETEASSGEVVYRHIFSQAFSFAGDFGGLVARAESATPSYVLTVWLQNNSVDPFVQMGTITIASNGAVSASTTSGNPFTAPVGSMLKVIAPASGAIVGLALTFVSV